MLLVNQLTGFGAVESQSITAEYIGVSTSVTSGSLSYPSGVAAGDLLILYGGSNDTSAPFTWSGATIPSSVGYEVAGGANTWLYWKVLTSGDISSPPTVGGSTPAWQSIAVRGPTGLTVKTANINQSGTSASLAGYTPGADSIGTVAAVCVRTAGGAADTAVWPSWVSSDALAGTSGRYYTYFGFGNTYTGGTVDITTMQSGNNAQLLMDLTV